MSVDFELEKDRAWFGEILERGPRRATYDVGGRVCQACGELALYEGRDEWDAAYAESCEVVGFSLGHERCIGAPVPHILACRRWRYCEVCRGAALANERFRRPPSWVCIECSERIARTNADPDAVLRDLALRRHTIRGRLPRTPAEEPPFALAFGGERRVSPPRGWLPRGLVVCAECGWARGAAPRPTVGGGIRRWKSTCLCEGIECRRCGERRVPRPVSDHYDLERGGWWHVPYFVGMHRVCAACQAAGS